MATDLEQALEIEAEGAEAILLACDGGLASASVLLKKGPDARPPTHQERRMLARFFAATVFNVIGLALPRYKMLQRFPGLQKAAQTNNCLSITQLDHPTAQVGSQPFQWTWSEMYDDAVLSDECLQAAMRSGGQYALSQEYPRAYFAKRHQIDGRSDAGFIVMAAGLAASSVLQEVGRVLDASEAALAQSFG